MPSASERGDTAYNKVRSYLNAHDVQTFIAYNGKNADPFCCGLISRKPTNPGGVTTSCALTASALGNAMSNQANPTPIQTMGRSIDDIMAELERRLDQGCLIGVSLQPDHHFVIAPAGSSNGGSNLRLLQAFEDVYDIENWLRHSRDGLKARNGLLGDLRTLLGDDQPAKMQAAGRLFAYDGVGDQVGAWFPSTRGIRVSQLSYKNL